MKSPLAYPVNLVVEGLIDEVVLKRILDEMGIQIGATYRQNGKTNVQKKILAYNNAARFAPWIVLVDLDRDAPCAPQLVKAWLPEPGSWMCFRVAVPQVEAWLLADREQIARFLRVPVRSVPTEPEGEPDAKEVMLQLAARSSSREIRNAMVPREGSGAREGPLYATMLGEFVQSSWRVRVARENANSLRRCILAIERLVSQWEKREDSPRGAGK